MYVCMYVGEMTKQWANCSVGEVEVSITHIFIFFSVVGVAWLPGCARWKDIVFT